MSGGVSWAPHGEPESPQELEFVATPLGSSAAKTIPAPLPSSGSSSSSGSSGVLASRVEDALAAAQSESDRKSYRLLRLHNGLEVMVIDARAANVAPMQGTLPRQTSASFVEVLDDISSVKTKLGTKSDRTMRRMSSRNAKQSQQNAQDPRRRSSRGFQRKASVSALVRPQQLHEDDTNLQPRSDEENSSNLDGLETLREVVKRAPSLRLDSDINVNRIATVSMAVGVGSFSEPDYCEGLAHFLEHMLFMGSEKYPRENEFDAFLSQNGGSSNAYTDAERTVYYFSCFQKDLMHGLDIFSQFFIAPLLLEEAAERELKSIESEFSLRQNVDDCRLLEIWRHSSRQDSPFGKFTCGNETSLKHNPEHAGVDVHEELRKFYDKFYVAPNMRLVVIGYDNLDNLEDMVCRLFADVRSGLNDPESVFTPTCSGYGSPWRMGLGQKLAQRLFDEGISKDILFPDLEGRRTTEDALGAPDGASLGCVFRIMPVADTHVLNLTWQLPPQYVNYQKYTTDYIGHLVGHESDGSVLADLKHRGWATSLDVSLSSMLGGFEDNTSCSLFIIQIQLTLEGLKNWIFVVGMVFEYIGILRREGPQLWIFEEWKKLQAASYRFKEEEDYTELAMELSAKMLQQTNIDPSWLLDGETRKTFDPEDIDRVLNHCRPELLRVDIRSSTLWPQSQVLHGRPDLAAVASKSHFFHTKACREPFMDAEYWVNRIPENVVNLWNGILEGSVAVVHVGELEFAGTLEETDSGADYLNAPDAAVISDVSWRKRGMFEEQFSRALIETHRAGTWIGDSLRLPQRNPFIPENFSVRKDSYKKTAYHGRFSGLEVQVMRRDPASSHNVKRAIHALQNGEAFAKSFISASSNPRLVHAFLYGSQNPLYPNATDEKMIVRRGRIAKHSAKLNVIMIDFGRGLYEWQILRKPDPSGLVVEEDGDDDDDDEWLAIEGSDYSMKLLESSRRRTELETIGEMSTTSNSSFSHSSRRVFRHLNPFRHVRTNAGEDDVDESEIDKIWASFPGIASDPMEYGVPALVCPGDSENDPKIWFMPDHVSRVPRTEAYVSILTPLPSLHPLFTALNDYFGALVFEAVRNESYLAYLADLDLNVESTEEGITIQIAGLSDKLPEFLDCVFGMFISFALASKRFATRAIMDVAADVKDVFDLVGANLCHAQYENLVTGYANEASHFQSEGELSSALYKILVHGSWHPEALADACDFLSKETVADYAALMMRRCRIEGCITGNVDLPEAQKVFRMLKDHLSRLEVIPLSEKLLPKLNVLEVPFAKVDDNTSDPWHAITGLVHPLEALEFEGHSVDLYFQLGPDDLETRLLAETLEHFMKEPLYADLRTRQQIGYMVQCSTRMVLGNLGFLVEVTSNNHPPHELASIVDLFFRNFRKVMQEMCATDFHENICAIARTKLDAGVGLHKTAAKLWEAIAMFRYRNPPQYEWKSSVAEIDGLRHIMSKKKFLAAFDRWLHPDSKERRRVSVLVFGTTYEGDALQELTRRSKFISIFDGELIHKRTPSCVAPVQAECFPTFSSSRNDHSRRTKCVIS